MRPPRVPREVVQQEPVLERLRQRRRAAQVLARDDAPQPQPRDVAPDLARERVQIGAHHARGLLRRRVAAVAALADGACSRQRRPRGGDEGERVERDGGVRVISHEPLAISSLAA